MRSRSLFVALSLLCFDPMPAPARVDGAADTLFSGDGFVHRYTTPGQSGIERDLRTLVPAADWLVAVGTRTVEPAVLFWESFAADGTLDGPGCFGAEALPGSGTGTTARADVGLVASTGDLVIGGALNWSWSPTIDRPLLASYQLTSGCNPNFGFSSNGWSTYFANDSFCENDDCQVLGLVEITPATGAVAAPRLVALVRAASGGLGASRHFLLAVDLGGQLDTGFSGDGWSEVAATGLGTPLFSRAALRVDPAGRLYVLVTHSDPGDIFDLDVSLLRYRADGVLDATFGTGGRLGVRGTGGVDAEDASVSDLVVTAGGSLFATLDVAGAGMLVWGRWSASNTTLVESLPETGGKLALQGDQRLIVARNASSDTTLLGRWDVSLPSLTTPDPAWNDGLGDVTYDIDLGGEAADQVNAVTLWNGRPVTGGFLEYGDPNWPDVEGYYAARFESRYVFADSFEGGTVATWSASSGLP